MAFSTSTPVSDPFGMFGLVEPIGSRIEIDLVKSK